MRDDSNLAGRVAVVTGGGSGIGRAIAFAFAEAGSRVVVIDRNAEGCEATVAEVQRRGAQALAVTCDISDPDSVQKAAQASEANFGPCDILVNNAGIVVPATLANITLDEWNRAFSVNLTGALLCSQAFGAQMRKRQRGAIVHISSITADHPMPWGGCYSITKAGVCMLSRLLAVEWAPDGIRSNVVKPGTIRTELTESFYQEPGLEKRRSELIPAGRIGRPEDIAQAALFLASDRASYITGQEIMVDGGFERMLMSLVPRGEFKTQPGTGS
ncbi:SDR family NAD(P)-dependent oxidoreductase [Noviherbaspirillum sedimenti]|uniref:SDR family oxidoreductase n=1 Tax=Noviherbaspirillum sedimenti TaxID=2320865 RepID=A0A3A3GQJ1_9BURK|nr:SDR family oxidoreductase [Noviherbaspirillum sedimenti]RJG03250.1 SDR family oxidoreductase [Noviherbaspirillum sedimenti]